MNRLRSCWCEHRNTCILMGILFAGFFLRLFYIGNIPGNSTLFSDESFAGYEAYSFLHYGYDSMGYVRPVYLFTWGSGMSVMQSYCMIPFVALFGLTTFAVRLPQAVLGCITLVAFYFLAKRIRNEKFALVATFLLAVMPWHVMMSRWALDCNFLPGFLVIATLFLLKGTEDSRWLPVSMLFYGLSLYCYAAAWPVMPIIVLGSVIYLLAVKKLKPDRWLLLSLCILLILTIPLILFILVNMGYMDEIRSGFISIPRLSHFRDNELSMSPRAVIKRMYDTLSMFVSQDDGRVTDVTPMFGLYYKFSYLFIIPGMACSVYSGIREKKRYPLETVIWIQLFSGVILGGLIEVVFSRINIIHIPLIYFCAVGVYELIEYFGGKMKYLAVLLYTASLIAFLGYYVTYYDDQFAVITHHGMQDALEYCVSTEKEDTTIHVISGTNYPDILFYMKFPTDEYIRTVKYTESVDSNLGPLSFGNVDYSCVINDRLPESVNPDDSYICNHDDEEGIEFMRKNGMTLQYFDYIVVGDFSK
jgi:hypothetical protein